MSVYVYVLYLCIPPNHTTPYHTTAYHSIPYHTIPHHTIPYPHPSPGSRLKAHTLSHKWGGGPNFVESALRSRQTTFEPKPTRSLRGLHAVGRHMANQIWGLRGLAAAIERCLRLLLHGLGAHTCVIRVLFTSISSF